MQRAAVRFDDSLSTVLAADSARGFGAEATWRQLVDLIGRGRVPGDVSAIARLRALRPTVPDAVRAASARALAFAAPPLALVALFAEDELGIGAPVLRTATLPGAEWVALLPSLTPAQRSVLRHRRDLPLEAQRGLESLGSVDFVLEDGSPRADGTNQALIVDPEPASVTVQIPSPIAPEPARFEIADLVARIEAHREHPPQPIAAEPPPTSFAFATDRAGIVRWVEGIARGALLGAALTSKTAADIVVPVMNTAVKAGEAFARAAWTIDGNVDVAGTWWLSGVPAFDGASGAFIGYRGIGRRQQARDAPATDAVRQLVHELRTPTNAIGGFSELIETELLGPIATPYRERAGVIRAQAALLAAAIDDLDTATRIEGHALDLRPGPLALAPLLAQVFASVQPQADARGVKLARVTSGDEMLNADGRATEQLFSRLLGVLIGFAEAGEEIVVDAVAIGHTWVDLIITRPRALPADAIINGIATSTAQPGESLLGFGFALRLASNLARELGGSLTIASDCLTLRLPAAEEERVEAAH